VLLENVVEGARLLTLTEPKEIGFDWPAACRIWRAEYCRMNKGLNHSDEVEVADFYAALFGFNGPIQKFRALWEKCPRAESISFSFPADRPTNLEVLARVKKDGAQLSYLIADLRSNGASSTAIFGVDDDGRLRIIQDGSDRSSRRMLPPIPRRRP
jgi:hypothetical protein